MRACRFTDRGLVTRATWEGSWVFWLLRWVGMQSELLGLWGLEGRDLGTLWIMDFLAYLVRNVRVWLAVWRCLCPASLACYGELQAQIVLACLNLLHMALYLEWLVRLVVRYFRNMVSISVCRSEDRPPFEVVIRLISMC